MSQSNITFEVWEQEFKDHFWTNAMQSYGGYPSTAIITFIDAFDAGRNPLKAELKYNGDQIIHDSYGSEDSKLKRVFYFPDYELYVMFQGTRASYEGEEWTEMKEVKPTIKTYEVYE